MKRSFGIVFHKLKSAGETYKWETHKFQEAVRNILAWKRHVLRSVQQEKAKTDMMDWITTKKSLIIVDFAMKVNDRIKRQDLR